MFMSYSILSIGTFCISHSSTNNKHISLKFYHFFSTLGILEASNQKISSLSLIMMMKLVNYLNKISYLI